MLRKLRIAFAVVFLALITLLFLDFTGTVSVFFGWLAKIQLVPAVLAVNVGALVFLVLLTLLFGRVYCSVICPLGVMQDVFAWFGKKFKKNRYSYSKEKKKLRFVLLGLYVILMVVPGLAGIAALLEPYSSFGLIVSSLLSPIYGLCNNLLASVAEANDSYLFYENDVWVKSAIGVALALALLGVLAFLAWRGGRTYCNTVCPVGTILGYLSKFSWFKIVIDTEKCNSCGLCAKNCKASCINSKEHSVDYSRCVACMDCIDKCNKGAVRFVHKAQTCQAEVSDGAVDDSRRKFIAVSAMAVSAAAVKAQSKKLDGGLAVIEDKKVPVRELSPKPAGSLSVRNFASRCTACQLCVSACPNGVLRPSASLDSFMQPEMSFEHGYCRPECVKCSEVCPAGAIKPISAVEKSSIQIGVAVWHKDNCLANKGEKCDNCARHCPVGAIAMIDYEGKRIPSVNTEMCIGCGACENLCPSRPLSGMCIEGVEEHRVL